MQQSKDELGIVVIFYNPNVEQIQNAKKLSKLYNLVIVDNSPNPKEYNFNEDVALITLNENVGIAKALNLGINYIKSQGYPYCLLLDQDSEPQEQLISGLLNFYHTQINIENIALVAPGYHDKALKRDTSFIQKGRLTMNRIPPVGNKAIEASYVISSGSLLNLACFNQVGPMLEELFIDFVDIEWCIRAQHKGFKVLGLPWLKMEHEIGCKPVTFLGKQYVNHSAIRHYYYIRNIFMLLRLPYIPKQWKFAELAKLLPRMLVYSVTTENKLEHIKCMSKGLYHGAIGRFGMY